MYTVEVPAEGTNILVARKFLADESVLGYLSGGGDRRDG